MKNRVNLYHAQFHPKLRLLSLPLVISSWLFTALCCVLLYFYETSEHQNIQLEIASFEENKQQQQRLITELQSALENTKVDPELLKQVEKSQQLISLKKHVLNELVGQKELKSGGFSNLMIDLASHSQKGLWLTHINLDGLSVVMEGAATDSSVVPKWLSSLGQTDYFRGQEFADTRLYRDTEQQLNFVISTGKESEVKKDTDNE
jgi:Tfp pilus assembly protein PilN